MPRTIWITRHGNREDFTDSNWAETAERRDDPDLSPDGIVQARELAAHLAPEPIDHLYSSPYLRAIHTAHCCALGKSLRIKVEDGIGEWLDPAKFTAMPKLLPRRELARRFQVDENYRPIYFPSFPEGTEALFTRCRLVIDKILAETTGNLLLVGHGASCKALIFSLLHHTIRLRVPLCSLTKLVKQNGRWRLELNGDTSFLSSGAMHAGKF